MAFWRQWRGEKQERECRLGYLIFRWEEKLMYVCLQTLSRPPAPSAYRYKNGIGAMCKTIRRRTPALDDANAVDVLMSVDDLSKDNRMIE